MVIRTYENCHNKKSVVIHEGYNLFLVEYYQFGDFKQIESFKKLKKAEKKAIKYINDKERK